VRHFCLIIGLFIAGLAMNLARGDDFKLTTGETLSGEVLPGSANDLGVQVKVGEGKYEKVPWGSFSQEDLKQFAAKYPKMQPFIEPFIEITPEERIKKTEVDIKQPPRLQRPSGQSLFGALFSSSLGWFIVLVLYAANIYAGYEVSVFRGKSGPLVCGLSAIPILGLLAPIIFLALKVKMPQKTEEALEPPPETVPQPAAEALNPMQDGTVEHPTGLKLAHAEAQPAAPALPPATTYQRGQFTFNRRFFETKFPGFFGVIRRDADRDMILLIKSARGEYAGQRITRIAANDLHLEVHRGNASEEISIPFQEIKEIQLKHKDA
jgi:hypothetical protein